MRIQAYRRAMQFRVLGPLEVSADDGRISLGGPKQRSVLARLLVRPNQVIPAEDLIDQVWGEDPPNTARKTLQGYVTHLRRVLGPDRLEWRAPGYVLHLDQRELDAARFESLVHEAKAANGRPDRAAALYRRALDMWRGPALADLAGDGALAAEAHRLDELRLEALEGRIAAELDAGRHAELVPELGALVREHPLRERLWGLLMVALYRSGRQADASATYHRAREVLSEELGLDPSMELQSLHERILKNDPALEVAHDRLRGYELVEEIGEGGFGVVYRAWQPQLAREVAIKAIRPALANDPEFIRRFEAEAQVVARLEHANIVPLYDYWREPGAAYLVLRWIRGGSLDETSRPAPLDLEAVARLEEQIASALSFAHRLGVVHSDLKPANVLLDEEGNAYLSDFGIAADLRGLRAEERDLRLSPAYLAPEQIRGDPATIATDIYCLGLLLFQVLCGVHPFAGTPPVALLRKQLDEPFPRVTERRSELSPAIDDVVARATAKDPRARFPDVAAFDLAFRDALRTDEMAIALGAEAELANPYKGLRPFGEADALDFFGRDALVGRLVSRLSEPVEGKRFLGLVGPSGSGKSSVVHAGLIPALRTGAIPGSDTWFTVEMMPGAHPFEELEAALLRIATNPPSTLVDQLEGDLGLLDAVERVLPPNGSELFLVVDQLEELFTHVDDEETRSRFLACLATVASDPRSRVRVLVTLRADHFDRPLAYPGFGPLLGSRTETVTTLTPAELELAIARPAQRIGVAIEPDLRAEIVADTAGRLGALPLLQFALTELFERRKDGALTLSTYREVGGVGGALAGRAEQLYETSDSDGGKNATRQVFLRLVNVDEGVEDLRRRVRRSELDSLEVDREAMAEAIDAFTRHRLLTSDRDPVTREPTLEVAHEALLRSWPRLRGWIDAAREDIRNLRRFASEAAQWEDGGRDPSFLLRGSRLERSAAWAGGSGFALTSAERQYLDASVRQRDQERRAEEAQRQREATLQRRSLTRLRGLVAALTVAAVVAASLAFVAVDRGRRAEREARIATSREMAAAAIANLEVDPDRSILLAIRAVETTRSADGSIVPEAEEALHTAVATSRLVRALPGGDAVDWSPRGVFAAIDGKDASDVNVSDVKTGRIRFTISAAPGDITDVVFSPDGSLVATTSDDGRLILWDASTGRVIGEASAAGAASGPSFSADGSALAAAWPEQGLVKLLDVSTGSVIRVIRNVPGASSTALEPYARKIAIGTRPPACDGRPWPAFEFDLRTGHRIPLAGSEPCGPSFLAWSPDGRYIAANMEGPGRGVQIWNAAMAGKPRFHLVGHTDSILSGDWSPDSSRLVTGSYDSTAKVWSVTPESARELYSLSTQDNRNVTDVAFSPDGAQVMTAYRVHDAAPRPFGIPTDAVRTWDVSEFGGAEVASLPSGCGGLARSEAAFVADRRQVILADERCRAAVWDLDGEEVRAIGPSPAPARAWWEAPLFEASSDGGTIATAPGDGTVSLWDAAIGNRVFSVREPPMSWFGLSASGDFVLIGNVESVSILDRSGAEVDRLSPQDGLRVYAAEMSPDDRLVAIATGQRVTIWNWERGTIVATIPAQTEFLAFDSSGTLLATAGDDRTPEIWTVESGELVRMLPPQLGEIYGLAFSPDGSRLAVGSADGTIRLADTLSEQEVKLPGDGDGLQDIAFNPDGSMLATTTAGGVARIWALDIDDLLGIARAKLTRSWTENECRTYLHLGTCPA
jgi:WD40 repeat protein/DNA-binding SARP family transcriptional activator